MQKLYIVYHNRFSFDTNGIPCNTPIAQKRLLMTMYVSLDVLPGLHGALRAVGGRDGVPEF